MKKRELYKVFEFEGRKWRIGKFDAMTGSYIAYRLMTEALPMGIGQMAGIPSPPGGKVINKQDFMELQRDCLSVCEELLPAGPTPVLNSNGTFGVIDLDNDAKTVFMLMVQTLMWNIADFFDENLLASLSEAISTIFQQDAKTSMNSSMPQS